MKQLPFVKICGITNAEQAKLAVDAGANLLGLIFVEESPRRISQEDAESIRGSISPDIKLVGVFKDSPLGYIVRMVKEIGLDYVQCHGSETSEFCSSIPFPIIKAIQISHDDAEAEEKLNSEIEDFATVVDYVLIDRPKDQSDRSDWQKKTVSLLKKSPPSVPYFFAGGLSHANLASILKSLEPNGVDVASGVESEPGKKDPEKLRLFFEVMKNASKNEGTQKK